MQSSSGPLEERSRSDQYPLGGGDWEESTVADAQKTPQEIFIGFNYPELKDLGKHFLTIASATAVFLVTFVDRILAPSATAAAAAPGAASPFNDTLVKWTLISLLASIISAGTGLLTNYVAGAGASGAIILGAGKNFRAITILTYALYLAAGTCLMAAYVALATIGVLK
jgi:hypothetical protein